MAKYYEGIDLKKGLGIELEESLTGAVVSHFMAMDDNGAVQYTGGTRLDIEQGTDLVIWGIPTDFTCNFAGKDHMEILPETVDIFGGVKVRFGVRTGNSHRGFTRFKTPVLVIGIDAVESFLGTWMENIVQAFAGKLDEIIETGQSQYWDWCDAHGIA